MYLEKYNPYIDIQCMSMYNCIRLHKRPKEDYRKVAYAYRRNNTLRCFALEWICFQIILVEKNGLFSNGRWDCNWMARWRISIDECRRWKWKTANLSGKRTALIFTYKRDSVYRGSTATFEGSILRFWRRLVVMLEMCLTWRNSRD